MLPDSDRLAARHHHRPKSTSTRKSRRAPPTMSLPQPPVPLKDHCSVIHQNTLYTYQSDAFQSLDLKEGGTWSKLPGGVSTNGSACVQVSEDGEDSLFIVGGTTTGSSDTFSGLQRFSFKTKKWNSCNPITNVTKNRVRHGSTYLQESSSILIYGGSQDGNTLPSSQTFVVKTTSPYDVQAYSSHVPPVINPLMMPWNSSHALMLGGAADNKRFSIFGPRGWTQLEPNLTQGLPDSRSVQTTLMDGDDGSKLLEIFNMEESPNQITTVLLQRPTVKPKSESLSATPTLPSSPTPSTPSSKKRKRETLEDRPAYNSTLAPLQKREGFSLAQDPQTSLVVATGGNDQDVLCIFNQTGNQWVDSRAFFGTDQNSQTQPTPSGTPPPASSPSSVPSPPSDTAVNNNSNSTHRSLTILGATLGSIFGVAILLILLLFLLRCIRRRQERQHRRRSSDYPMDDKNDMDFADQGAEYMKEAGGSFGHHHNTSGQSGASGAATAGRAPSSQSKRGFFHKQSGSNGSAKSFFSRNRSPLTTSPPQISEPFTNPPPGERNFSSKPMASPEPRTEPRTDEGWSQYWANSNTNIGQSTNPRESQASRPTTYTSASRSDYAGSQSTHPHESAEVQPLNIRSSQNVVSPTSGTPLPGLALSHSNHGAVGPEPQSPNSIVSDIEEEDEYRLEHPPSHEGQSSWTPVATSERGSTWEDRPISSVYADSLIYPHPGERVRIPNFPGVPPSRRPSDNMTNVDNTTAATSAPPINERGMRSTAARDFGRGPASHSPDQQERDLPEVGIRRERERMERERMERLEPARLEADRAARARAQAMQQEQLNAAVRTFPRRPEELGPRGRGGKETEDMSWLNLGR